jgi:hypothetical protein
MVSTCRTDSVLKQLADLRKGRARGSVVDARARRRHIEMEPGNTAHPM